MDWIAIALLSLICLGILIAAMLFSFSIGYKKGILDERQRYVRWRQNSEQYLKTKDPRV